LESSLLFALPFALGLLLVIVALQLRHLLIGILIIIFFFALSAHALHAWHVSARAGSATEFGEVDAAETAVFAHAAAELVEIVVFGGFVLLVFIDPLESALE